MRQGDKIYFSSVKFQGSFLRVSAGAKGPVCTQEANNHPYMRLHQSVRARYEINGSGMFSRLQIKPFQSLSTFESKDSGDHVKDIIKGMTGVIFIHRQNDTVLCGGKNGDAQWVPRAQVSLDHGMVAPRGMWVLKKAKVEWGGTSIERKGEPVVIEHVLTGSYLATSSEGYALMLPNLWQEECIWNIQAHSEGGEGASGGVATGEVVWVLQGGKDAGKDENGRRWLSDMSAETNIGSHVCGQGVLRQGGEPDNNDVIELRVCSDRHVRGIESVRRAQESLMSILVYLQLLEPLPEGLEEGEAVCAMEMHPVKDILRQIMPVFEESMRRLINPCTQGMPEQHDPMLRKGSPVKDHQDLLNELGTLELLADIINFGIDVLRLPVRKLKTHLKHGFRFFRLCYLCIGNEHAARHIPAARPRELILSRPCIAQRGAARAILRTSLP